MRTLAATAALALALAACSEAFYYDISSPLPELALWYLVPTAAFAWVLRRFRVASAAGVVLAGAVYGFVVEGVLVTVRYDAPLTTVSYTSLAWHLLVSVALGVVAIGLAIGLALRDARSWPMPVTAVGFGALLGLWWPAWGIDRAPLELAGQLLVATAWLAGAHAALGAWSLPHGRPARIVTVLTGAVLVALFVAGPLAAVPWAPALLLPLLGACWVGLRSEPAGEPSLLERLAAPIHLARLGWLAVIPAVAVAVFALARPIGAEGAQALVGGTQLVAGYVAFAWSLAVAWRRRRTDVVAGVARS